MKLSNVEITYDRNGESFSISDVRLSIILGFGLHQTWMFSVMFGSEKAFSSGLPDQAYFVGLFFSLSLAAFILNFFLCAFMDARIRDRFFSKHAIVAIAIVDVLSTVAILGGSLSSPVGSFFFFFSSIVSGLASSSMILQWGNLFSDLDIPSTVINTVGSFVVGIALYTLVFHQFAYPFSIVAAAIIPGAEGVFLYHSFSKRATVDDESFVLHDLPIRKAAFARQICVPMMIFGITMGIFGQSSLRTVLVGTNQSDQIIVVVAASLTAILLIVCIFLTQTQDLNFLYRPLLPITAISLLLVPQISDNVLLIYLVLLMGFLCFEVLMWVTTCEICSRYRISPLLAFGLSRGCLAAGTLLIDVMQRGYAYTTGAPLILTDFNLVAVSLVALVIGYALLPRQKDMEVLAVGPLENSPQDSAKEGPQEHIESAAHQPGKFMRKCQTVADKHLLTNKETEILFMLAKGRNAGCIQEQLFISENTVRTHMRHIYRKLEVHTQQELIDLVEGE